jgi:hypothetical protein
MQGATQGANAFSFDRMLPMAANLMGGQQQQQSAMPAPQIRRGEAPQLTNPFEELMRMQMMTQRQRRPISLL